MEAPIWHFWVVVVVVSLLLVAAPIAMIGVLSAALFVNYEQKSTKTRHVSSFDDPVTTTTKKKRRKRKMLMMETTVRNAVLLLVLGRHDNFYEKKLLVSVSARFLFLLVSR